MNKDMKAVARLMKRGHGECGICHDSFKTRLLRAVLHDNVVQLVCPGCIQNVPNAKRSSMSVEEIRAWKAGKSSDKIGQLNQCDGCRRGLPLQDGIHYANEIAAIGCTKSLYAGPDLDSLNTWGKS